MKKEKKNTEVKEETTSEQDFVEQEDGVKDPVLNRTQPIQTYEYEADPLKSIEESRKQFFGLYKSQGRVRLIISSVGILLCIAIFIVIPNVITDGKIALPVQLGSVGLVLCGLLVYSMYTKKNLNKKMREYFSHFYEQSNKYALNGKGFKEVEYQNPDKISIDQFTDNMMYKNIVEVGSRGLTSFRYNNIPAMICDCAGQIKTQKRIAPVFVGKYLFAPANYDDENIMIIYLKGDQRSLPPTNVGELKAVIDNEKIVIYTNNKHWKNVYSKELKELLDEVTLSQDLVDLAISLTPGRCFVCMGYDDPLMVLPLERPYNPGPIKVFKRDLVTIMKIIEELNK